MTDRPKRVITKPSRYQTTSSEESPKHRRMEHIESEHTEEDMEQDIRDLRNTLEDPDNSINNNTFNNIINTQTHTYPHITLMHANQNPAPPISASHPTQYSHTTLHNIPVTSSQYHVPLHTYDKHIDTEMQTQSYYTNTQHSQFQLATSPMGPSRQQHAATMAVTNISAPNEAQNFFRSIHERMDRFEAEMKKVNNTLQSILKCMETSRDRKRMPRKPTNLPICSRTEMEAFETISDEEYEEVINYFIYIGGFNLKEAINLCFKEAIKDDVTPSFTWWGREGGPRPLYNARIIMAIYEGICGNRHLNKPTRSEFQAEMREAIRTAKQRHRNKQRQPRAAGPNRRRRDFWNDEEENLVHSDD